VAKQEGSGDEVAAWTDVDCERRRREADLVRLTGEAAELEVRGMGGGRVGGWVGGRTDGREGGREGRREGVGG